MKITKEQFDSLFGDDITKKQYDQIVSQIDKRFSQICEKFLRKGKGGWYDYDNVSYDTDSNGGWFDPDSYNEEIYIGGEYIEPPSGYGLSIPTRWLWEDFEDELKDEVAKFKAAEEKKKRKAAERRIILKGQKELLKESIRSKLTPQELKIIKFS